MEFLEIPLYDDDMIKLIVRFTFNFVFMMLIVRYIYYPAAGKKDYLFTYFMINVLVFFICFTLKKFELELGMALGLFAIFGILRYRTDPIPIKEMTYIFVMIGIGVVNALANKKMSYTELVFTNGAITAIAFVLEKVKFLNNETKKVLTYEKIDLIAADKYPELVKDLETRTGLKINRAEIAKMDFLRDVATIVIYYDRDQPGGIGGH